MISRNYAEHVNAIAWGVTGVAIAFWMNLLVDTAFPKMLSSLLIVPIMEETIKCLGLRRTGSIIIPIFFLIGESVVQVSGYLPLIRDTWIVWAFYIPFSIVTFKHLLFYVIMYIFDFRIHGLLLAILAHSAWNWYSTTKGKDDLPLSLVTLAMVMFPLLALYKRGVE